MLSLDEKIHDLALELYTQRSLLVMGRGYNYATCLEGALVSLLCPPPPSTSLGMRADMGDTPRHQREGGKGAGLGEGSAWGLAATCVRLHQAPAHDLFGPWGS